MSDTISDLNKTLPPIALPPIVLTSVDQRRLQVLLASEFTLAIGTKEYLNRLRRKLEEAKVVDSSDVTSQVVTMNSTFRLRDTRTNETFTYTLVYPQEACIAEGKLSILTPLGSEVLGHSIDDEIICQVQDRREHRIVEAISFQPERIGAFNL